MTLTLPGRSLRSRLLLVLVVPAIGMTAFAALWAGKHLSEARAAEVARMRADETVCAAKLLVAVDLTRTMVELVNEHGGVDALGEFRPIVEGQAKIRTGEILTVADALRRGGSAHTAGAAPSHADADAPLTRILSTVDGLAGTAFEARPPGSDDAPSAIFTSEAEDALDAAAREIEVEVLRLHRSELGSGQYDDAATLLALADVQRQTLKSGAVSLVASYGRFRVSRAHLREDAAAVDSATRLLVLLLPEDTRRFLSEWNGSPAGRRWATMQRDIVDGRAVNTVAGVPLLIKQMQMLESVQTMLSDRMIGDAEATARSARRSFQTALWIAAALLIATLLLAVLMLRPTTRVLHRLAQRARTIGAGELAVEPLAVSGHDEAAVLARSFDEMSGTLRTLHEQVNALADGRTDDPVLTTQVPGRIGDALSRSVNRLSETTTRLQESEQRARLTVDTAVEAIWTLDADHRVVDGNPASFAISGRTPADLTGSGLGRMLEGLPAPSDVQGDLTNAHSTLRRPDGSRVDVLVSTRRVTSTDGTARTMVFARDISEQKRFEERLEWEAMHDSLTELPNRTALTRGLDGASADRDHPMAVLFVDLDGFKHVNDALGHRIGDGLLREVAERLRGEVRADDVVARLGGDEFVILVRDKVHDDDLDVLARRILKTLERPFEVAGTHAYVSASIGIAVTFGEVEPSDLVRRADLAMYRAKQGGRGQVQRYDESMHSWARTRVELEEALRDALGNDGLEAHFQPIVDAENGRIRGVELLARWSRPGHGPVAPSTFIPLAEDTGLITDIGRWALGQAARVATEIRAAHPEFDAPIAVNISGVHLMHGDLVNDVDAALAQHGADPRWLAIEITESYLLSESVDRVDHTLRRLVDRGVSLAIDDFGTGYSSLTYLRRLPAEVVKIDRSFIATGHDGIETGIVELVSTLAHGLGMVVVAEGVETPQQLDMVRAAGCDHVQGYLLGRPMTLPRFLAWLPGHLAPLMGSSPRQ